MRIEKAASLKPSRRRGSGRPKMRRSPAVGPALFSCTDMMSSISAGHCDARVAAPFGGGRWRLLRSGGFDQPELGQRSHAVVEADLLDDFAIDHLQYRGAAEVHFATGRSW